MTGPRLGERGNRREDGRLLAGHATFVSDVNLPHMVEAAFVRSPFAHAKISGINTGRARASDSAIFVATRADADSIAPYPDPLAFQKPVGFHALAGDRVRYVGTAVAVVVAANRDEAEDVAELVEVDYEPLPPVVSITDALADDAPLLYPEWGDNKVLDFPACDPVVDELFQALPSVRTTFRSQRQGPNPMETRAVVADWSEGRLTVWTTQQSPFISRATIAQLLSIPESRVRVISPGMGGAFGCKLYQYGEELVVPWLAMKLGRPVRWIEDRSEHMTGTIHAREQEMDLEAAYEPDGTIRALRGTFLTNQGSGELYISGTATTMVSAAAVTGAYRIDHAAISMACVVTNKTPSGAYRGFGQPESVFAMERTIELVAEAAGVDAVDLRKRMLLKPDEHPYTMPSGNVLDSGSHLDSYLRARELGQVLLDRVRRRYDPDPSKRVGMGTSSYVESTTPTYFGATAMWTAHDSIGVGIEPDGTATVRLPMTTMGQGAETLVESIILDQLGIDGDDVAVILGDTDQTPYGLGSFGARGMTVTSGALAKASATLIEKGKAIAAGLLEASAEDIEFTGAFHVRGSPAIQVGWRDVAYAALVNIALLPTGVEPGLSTIAYYDPPNIDHIPDERGKMNACASWSNASHAAIVVVDLLTGLVDVEEYAVVHDCGRILNPTVVDGQIVGGVAQGIAGALYEELAYDRNGQPLTANLMNYLIPTASEIPSITIDHFESPAPTLTLGAKGMGESGAIGSCAAIANAVCDALAEYGVSVTEMPITPTVIRQKLADHLPDSWKLITI